MESFQYTLLMQIGCRTEKDETFETVVRFMQCFQSVMLCEICFKTNRIPDCLSLIQSKLSRVSTGATFSFKTQLQMPTQKTEWSQVWFAASYQIEEMQSDPFGS